MTRPDLPIPSPSVRRWGSPPAARALGRASILPIALAIAVLLGCSKAPEEQLAEIRLQQEIGSWEESVAQLREFIRANPDHAEANFLLGTAHVRLQQPALAIWPLEIAARSPEWASRANLMLGTSYLLLEQFDQALAVADLVLDAQPEDAEERLGALRLRAAVHLSTKEWDAAIEDTELLLSMEPDNPDSLLLRARALALAERGDEAETLLRRIWEMPSLAETSVAAQAGLSLVWLLDEQLHDPERAEAQLEAVLERFATQREVLAFTLRFFNRTKRPERAAELLRSALAREPNNLGLRSTLAEHLVQQGEGEEAERLLVEAVEILESPEARITLAEFYRMEGKYEEALAELERTLEMLPGVTDYLRFKHADLLAIAGHLDRAEEVAGQISEPAYRDIVAGRIAYDRGDERGALERLDSGLRRWPNNPGARYLAGMAALRLGMIERAISEFRESSRVEAGGTDAALELARIQLSQGNPKAAVVTAARVLGVLGRGDATLERRANALLLVARAQSALGLHEQARKALESLLETEGQELTAALELAELEARAGDPEAAIRSLEESQLDLHDPANGVALAALCQHLVAAGRPAEALQRVDTALAKHPEVATYHNVRARLLFKAGRSEEAKRSFDRALELDPGHGPALEGLALLAEAQGELERARSLLDRAAEADTSNASYPYQVAQLELAAGRTQEAGSHLREALRRDPLHPQAANDLAWMLAERGDNLDLALRLALHAREADESAAVLDTLGWVQFKRGDYQDAVASLEAAQALEPESPSISYRLGLALIETGEADRARALLQEALDSGEFPESEEAQAQLGRLVGTQP